MTRPRPPKSSTKPPRFPASIYRRALTRPSSFQKQNRGHSTTMDPTLREILASVERFAANIPADVVGVATAKAAAASSRRKHNNISNTNNTNSSTSTSTNNLKQPLILLNKRKKYRPKMPASQSVTRVFKRPESSLQKRRKKRPLQRKQQQDQQQDRPHSTTPGSVLTCKIKWSPPADENKTASGKSIISLSQSRNSITALDPHFVPSFVPKDVVHVTRNHIPQKALESKIIQDTVKAMKTFEITPEEIETIVDGLSHSAPKPTPQANRENNKLKRFMRDQNMENDISQNLFAVKLPKSVIVAKNEARNLVTTMSAIEHGTLSHDEKEVASMERRTNRSRSLVRDLRAEDENLDHVCHTKTAALLDIRMKNLRNQANQLGLEIKTNAKLKSEKARRNHIAKELANAQIQKHDPNTMKILNLLCAGDGGNKNVKLLITMISPRKILPLIKFYEHLQRSNARMQTLSSYSPILRHMLSNLKQEYHQASLKSEALNSAINTVHKNLKEFHVLQVAMNHASILGEDRLDAINQELNINREERLNAVRLRQENLLAQQRLKRKLAVRERQRRDKKQHAMLMAQKSSHYEQMKGDKQSKNAAVAGMRLMERRLLGKQLLSDENAKFPPFMELQKMIGDRTNVNVETPSALLKRMLNHTSEISSLERELVRLEEKRMQLNRDIPMLEGRFDLAITNVQSSSMITLNEDETDETIDAEMKADAAIQVKVEVADAKKKTMKKKKKSLDTKNSMKTRSIRKQRRDIEIINDDYNTKFKDFQHQFVLINNAVNGIHSTIQQYETMVQTVTKKQKKSSSSPLVSSPLLLSTSNNNQIIKEKLNSLLNEMMNTSILSHEEAKENEKLRKKKETIARSAAGGDDTKDIKDIKDIKDTEGTEDTEDTEDKEVGKYKEDSEDNSRKYETNTNDIIQQVSSMFHTFTESMKIVMNSIGEKRQVGSREQQEQRMEQPTNILSSVSSPNTSSTAPLLLKLSKSTEELLSENNIRVKSYKFTVEISKGEQKRLNTLLRVKTLREIRTSSEKRPKHRLLSAIHVHLQNEQDVLQRSGFSSLRTEQENGQTIIRSFEDIKLDDDNDQIDSEDEELNQSRMDMKRSIRKITFSHKSKSITGIDSEVEDRASV